MEAGERGFIFWGVFSAIAVSKETFAMKNIIKTKMTELNLIRIYSFKLKLNLLIAFSALLLITLNEIK
jgi:hypothetical protein